MANQTTSNEEKSITIAEEPTEINESQISPANPGTDEPIPVTQNKTKGELVKACLRRNLLLILTICGVVLGIIIGFSLRTIQPSSQTIMLVGFLGEVFMRLVQMLILPLIVSSMISGIAQLNPRHCRRMGRHILIYYAFTTVMAVILGVVLVLLIKPGSHHIKTKEQATSKMQPLQTLDAFLDLIRNIFPENLVQACFQVGRTNKTVSSTGSVSYKFPYKDGMNMLGIIVFSIAFGVVVARLSKDEHVMADFFTVLNTIIMKLLVLVIWYSPIGIMFLVASKIMDVKDLVTTGRQLGLYMATIIIGLIIHTTLTLFLTYAIITRKNPLVFFRGMLQAFFLALGTASSAATLPVTFRCLEDNLHIDSRVTRFVLPIGMTVNMDGTALYEAVAAIFIAQLNDFNLSFGQVITISITATLASVGAASMPSAGLITLIIVVGSVGLPVEDISIIVAVDWLLDRFRTSVNVLGDSFGAGILDHLVRADLEKYDAEMLEARKLKEAARSEGRHKKGRRRRHSRARSSGSESDESINRDINDGRSTASSASISDKRESRNDRQSSDEAKKGNSESVQSGERLSKVESPEHSKMGDATEHSTEQNKNADDVEDV